MDAKSSNPRTIPEFTAVHSVTTHVPKPITPEEDIPPPALTKVEQNIQDLHDQMFELQTHAAERTNFSLDELPVNFMGELHIEMLSLMARRCDLQGMLVNALQDRVLELEADIRSLLEGSRSAVESTFDFLLTKSE